VTTIKRVESETSTFDGLLHQTTPMMTSV